MKAKTFVIPLLVIALLVVLIGLTACQEPPAPAPAVRLVDLFANATVIDAVEPATDEPMMLRFDGGSTVPDPDEPAGTLGWEIVHQVEDLAVRDGLLTLKTTGESAGIVLKKPENLGEGMQMHALELRLRSSAEIQLAVQPIREKLTAEDFAEVKIRTGFTFETQVEAGDEPQTYTLVNTNPQRASSAFDATNFYLVFLRGDPGADVAIESLRFISRKEHLASVPSGIGFHDLGKIYQETLTTRAPEKVVFEVNVPERPWMIFGIGTIDDGPVRFKVNVRKDAQETAVLTKTVTTPGRWERADVDLSPFAGQRVELILALDAEKAGQVGLWGAPVIRSRGVKGEAGSPTQTRVTLGDVPSEPPRGVVLILADTLRRDRLPFHGHDRPTAPHLTALAENALVFENAIAQGTWTKASVPSILSSLYPSTHGLVSPHDRISAVAETMPEVFRDAGYATLTMSSVAFTGQNSNLHQGVETLHERTSLGDLEHSRSKTARIYVDRLLPWLEDHRDVPFFVFLQIFDPHDPFKPYAPYDRLFSTAEENAAQEERAAQVAESLDGDENHLPTREELAKAEVDADAFVDHELDWYDASIRGMDTEIGRLLEGMDNLGLRDDVAIVFFSDHGEEFLEHGKHFHGTSTYSELTNVPFFIHWPRVVPAQRVPEVVQMLDLMPTVLDLALLEPPEAMQGQSLVPLMTSDATAFGWRQRPAFSEKHRMPNEPLYEPEVDSFAVVSEGWKLVQNTERPEGHPEFELYRTETDPLDQDDVAAEHPEVVAKLAGLIEEWQEAALAAKLPEVADAEMSPEELERLRALGYVN